MSKLKNLQNKQKIIVGIGILAIIAIFALCIGKILIENSQQFTLCEIQTYNGDKIENYNNNKRAFIISNYDEETTIKVNGKEYTKNLGFYDVGTYEVEAIGKEKTEKYNIKINEINKNKQNEYNIFMLPETLPTFFSCFDMIKEKDVPSYVWYQRANTLNNEELKKVMSDVTISKYVGEQNVGNFMETVAPEVKEYVNNVLQKDENAHFNVYVTAEFYWTELVTLTAMGLSDDRVNTVMYSCGTIDYVVDYSITKENSYDSFVSEKQNYEATREKAKSNLYANVVSTANMGLNPNYVLLNALRDNVTYYLQFPEIIKFKDNKVNEEMKNANMKKIIAREQFDLLDSNQKETFFKCINFDKETFDKEYFNSENGKYLVITGTKPYYGKYSKNEFENMISQVVEKYEKEYTILFKPHPSALPEESEQKYLSSLNIKVLPGKMPMEAIAFVYKDIKLGGFASSLYMSVDEGSTYFFFANKKEELVDPLNVLYDDLFKNAEFIQPKINNR